MEQINILAATNARLTSNGGNREKQGGQATTGNDYESILDLKGYFWTNGYKFVRGNIKIICTKRNDEHMEKSTRDDTMGGMNKNSG